MSQNAHDYFKNMRKLFESNEKSPTVKENREASHDPEGYYARREQQGKDSGWDIQGKKSAKDQAYSEKFMRNQQSRFNGDGDEVNEISDATAASSTKKREANNRAGKDPGSEKLLKNYRKTDDREVRKTGKSSTKGPALGENRFAANNPDMDDNDMQDYWERRQDKADDERKAKKEEPKKKTRGPNKDDSSDGGWRAMYPSKSKTESAAGMMRKYVDFITEAEEKEEWNIVSGDDQVIRGPYDDELSAHDALAKLKKSATDDDECSGYRVTCKESVNESFGDDDDEDPDVAKADKVKGKDGKTQKDSEKKLPPWLQKKGAFDKKDKKDEEKGAKKAKKED